MVFVLFLVLAFLFKASESKNAAGAERASGTPLCLGVDLSEWASRSS